jgi:hypothetical protein
MVASNPRANSLLLKQRRKWKTDVRLNLVEEVNEKQIKMHQCDVMIA